MGGLYRQLPWLAALFLVPALSLAGIPPLSGFWAKLAVIRAGLEAGEWLVVTAALAAGVLTLLSMIKIWSEAFWKTQPDLGDPPPVAESVAGRGMVLLVAPAVGLALITILIGLFPGTLFDLAGRAAQELLDPSSYLAAVGLAVTGGAL
jgi:multicomponent Na+:H+ antiporter subunit D